MQSVIGHLTANHILRLNKEKIKIDSLLSNNEIIRDQAFDVLLDNIRRAYKIMSEEERVNASEKILKALSLEIEYDGFERLEVRHVTR